MKTKSAKEVASVLNHSRKQRPVTTEEMDLALHDHIRLQMMQSDREAFRKILDNVPDTLPVPGDEIIKND